jgi:WD40 repeat protein
MNIHHCGTGGPILLTAYENGAVMYRADSDGGNLQRLGPGFLTACSPDGSWYLYNDQDNNLVRAPLAGGAPKILAERTGGGNTVISPDGKRVLYSYQEYVSGIYALFAGVISSDGGPRLASFRMPIGVGTVRWSKSGDAFQYAVTRDGAGNIWEQPLSGTPPRQVTRFPAGQEIRGFAWSPDGKQLAVVRASTTSNVVVISDFR